MTPGVPTQRLVAYGHSWVAGDGASQPDRCLVSVAARSMGLTPVNLGVGGTSSAQTADLVVRQGVPAAAAYLVMTGLNDARLAGTTPAALAAYRRALCVIISACRVAAPDSPVIVVEQPALVDYSLFPPHDRGSTEAIGRYNDAIREDVDTVAGVELVRVPDWDASTMLALDTVHPNDAGHATIGRAVAAAYLASTMGSTSPVHD